MIFQTLYDRNYCVKEIKNNIILSRIHIKLLRRIILFIKIKILFLLIHTISCSFFSTTIYEFSSLYRATPFLEQIPQTFHRTYCYFVGRRSTRRLCEFTIHPWIQFSLSIVSISYITEKLSHVTTIYCIRKRKYRRNTLD